MMTTIKITKTKAVVAPRTTFKFDVGLLSSGFTATILSFTIKHIITERMYNYDIIKANGKHPDGPNTHSRAPNTLSNGHGELCKHKLH